MLLVFVRKCNYDGFRGNYGFQQGNIIFLLTVISIVIVFFWCCVVTALELWKAGVSEQFAICMQATEHFDLELHIVQPFH